MSDNPFHAAAWSPVDGFADLTDITYHRNITEPTVRVAFNRPEVRNAFRPHTVDELYRALDWRADAESHSALRFRAILHLLAPVTPRRCRH